MNDLNDLNDLNGKLLLSVARDAVRAEMFETTHDSKASVDESESELAEPAATFVTIRRHGQLHGCIGSLSAVRPLGEDLRHNACAAAFRDPRSRALTPEEFEIARFEVSVLSPREPVPCNSFVHALEQVRPGIDGIVVSAPGHRGVFLPQVWEQLPSPSAFLDALWRKAGLEPGAWPTGVAVERFSVHKFVESDDG